MSRIPHLLLTLATCSLAAAPIPSVAATVPLYRFVDLGPDTRALDVNDHGAVAGVHGERAAIWRDGTWRHRAGDMAMAIDDEGQVVGQFKNDLGTYSSLYWPHGGTPVPVTMPFENVQVLALGVANGRVVGYSEDPTYKTHCFVWNADTATAVDLGVGRDGRCYAYDINEAGQAVGQISPPGTEPRTGFIWQNGIFQYLGLLPGGTWSSADAINRKGHVAMTATRLRHDGVLVWRPALWNGQRIVDLGTVERRRQCDATALNDLDEVVGRYYQLGNRGWRTFLHTGGQMYPLESLVENLDGRTLTTAAAISNDGTIVGIWRNDAEGGGYRLERITTSEDELQP
jgi:probable HAF family extracellular repeat protein